MKTVRLLAVAGLLLLLGIVSAGAYSVPAGKDPVTLTGVSVPAGMECSGQVLRDGNHLVMDICMDGTATSSSSSGMIPSGTRYMGTERLDIVLVPTSTPGVYNAQGNSHGFVDFVNGWGKIHARIDGSFHGVMVFDQSLILHSFSFTVEGGLNILSGEGGYASVNGGGGHYAGTSILSPSPVYDEHDSLVAWVS